MNTNESNRRLLHRRWVYRTLREVWLVDGQTIEKHFTHHPGRRDWRPLWKREHEALIRLEGLPVPRSLGWHQTITPEGPCYILRKSYLPGDPLRQATMKDAEDMGALLARFHQRLVVNNDPALGNFVRAQDGTLACVDFGRSRTFRWPSGYYLFYVGKELSRLYRTSLQCRPDLWASFSAHYHAHSRLSVLGNALVRASFAYWNWRGLRHHPANTAWEQAR